MKLRAKICQALQADAAAVPLLCLNAVSSSVQVFGSERQAALGQLLEERRDLEAAQVWLRELISKAQRQVGATQCLHTTFAARFAEIPESTLEALPEHTRRALTRIVELAEPFPVIDPMLLAHALTIDGETCRLIAELNGEPEKPKESGIAAARRILQEHHPDKGGDAKVFAAVSEMYRALK